jgi:urease accessory protein
MECLGMRILSRLTIGLMLLPPKAVLRLVLLAFGALLLAPSMAQAHLVTTGLGPFYDGAMHLALSPDDWLGLFAAALLAGLRGPQAGRWTLAMLPAAWVVGATVGLLVPGVPALPGISILSFVVLGLLVALDVKLPAWGVATVAGLFGLLHGLLNGAALSQANAGVLNVLGIVTTVFVLLLLVSAAVMSLRPAWTRVAVRVAGSWVVAVGMLMFGWLFREAT